MSSENTNSSPHLTPQRAETQARVCAQAIIMVLRRTLLQWRPADRSLREVFYVNRQFGSRDRRLISETLFSVLRWWGWLQGFAPNSFQQEWETACANPPSGQETSDNMQNQEAPDHLPWCICLTLGWLLENPGKPLPDAVGIWRRGTDLPRKALLGPSSAAIQDRQDFLRELFPCSETFATEKLLPEWCYTSAQAETPEARRTLLEWHQQRPPVWLRAQVSDAGWLVRQLAKDELQAVPHAKMQNALQLLSPATNLKALNCFRQGDFEIQDISSQCVALVCQPAPGEQWWDACAGGGGKTLHLAWLMGGKGSVLATDLRLHKLEELKLRARRAQFPNIRCKEWKGKAMPTFNNRFDGVLVDTPCSCSGTWRRNPDGRWTTTPTQVADCANLQAQLLENASSAVKKGGTLVYSTCSMFAAENQDVVKAFLEKHPDFSLVQFHSPIRGRTADGMLQIHHQDGNGDAMFIAKMQRKA